MTTKVRTTPWSLAEEANNLNDPFLAAAVGGGHHVIRRQQWGKRLGTCVSRIIFSPRNKCYILTLHNDFGNVF